MANNYEQILALVNAGNKMGLSNTITRDNGIPLDLSSIYGSYADAVIYAETKAIAYYGQPIAVVTDTDATLYVITPISQGKEIIDGAEHEVYLKPVGTKTLVDNKSIFVDNDGTLSLAGFSEAASASLPQKQADGTIEWVAISDIVEHDGNTKTIVTSDDTRLAILTDYNEASDSYTYTLGLNIDFNDYYVKSEVDAAISAIKTASDAVQIVANSALAAATEAAEAVVALNDGQVTTNKNDIAAIVSRLSTVEAISGTNTSDIANTIDRLAIVESAVEDHATKITGIENGITALIEEDAKLAELVATKANIADVYTKAEADIAFMSQDRVDERINALIVAADPDGGKAITSIQNLVKYVDENAGEITKLITDTTANTAKLAGIDSTVAEHVAEHIANATLKASNEITIDNTNTLGIREISTDKLVQGSQTLVISGGGSAN